MDHAPHIPDRSELAELAKDFAGKRRVFLASHKADYQSAETGVTYEASEDALEALEDALHDNLQSDPGMLAELLGG